MLQSTTSFSSSLPVMQVGTPPKCLGFNSKAAMADNPIVQKEVDELLTKNAIEPSTGGPSFYSCVFFVAKHTGGL